jgi:hypothetical protein
MPFSPNKPENTDDLMVFCDPIEDEVVIFMYDAGEEGLFYRHEGEWRETLGPEDNYELNLDDLSLIYVRPEFISVYDEAQELEEIIPISEVLEYQSIDIDELDPVGDEE